MNQPPNQPMKSSNIKRHGHIAVFLRLALIVFGSTAVWAQGPFISGSTGLDGDFSPTTNTTVSLPDTGVLNYKTVTIPTGVTVRFLRNARNTPVTILAQGAVIINGVINVSGEIGQFFGGQGGPGGYDGGRGGYTQGDSRDGVNGSGPGGGAGARFVDAATSYGGGGGGLAIAGGSGRRIVGSGTGTDPAGGTPYGTTTLVPLLGGSGGGGGTPFVNNSNANGGGGGGGGGAILIASSVSISGSGQVFANGGNGGFLVGTGSGSGGGGAGGAIRMVSNSISGSLTLSVSGAIFVNNNTNGTVGSGGAGYVRLEGVDTTRPPTITPPTALYTTSAPRPAVLSNAPQLRIVSVGGVNAPNFVTGSFNGADIYLPRQTGSVNVALAGTNLPLATVLQVVVVPPQGVSVMASASALSGSQASSTATASITLPPGPSLIYATGIVDLTLISGLAPLFQNGERVQKMEISAVLGGVPETTYITESGKRFKKLSE